MPLNELVIVLGSTIRPDGSLSDIAIERLEVTRNILSSFESPHLIITGGFGPHFNKTDKAYSLYAYEYLVQHGISKDCVTALIPSTDTVEDATLTRRVLKGRIPSRMSIVTSDFHVPRATYIFNIVFKETNIKFVSVPHITDNASLAKLLKTEESELILLKTTGKSSLGSILISHDQ